MKDFLLNNLVLIYKGGITAKLGATFKLAVVPSLGVSILEHFAGYYLSNLSFLYSVLFIIMLDHILGSIIHWREHNFSFKENLVGLIKKLGISISGYSLLLIMHDALNEIDFLDVYFMVMVKLMVLLYPGGSALVNMSKITNGAFPPSGLLSRIKNFEKTGNIDSFKQKEKSDEDT